MTPRTRLVSLIIHHSICIISIIRLVALYRINNSDLTWSNEPPGLWTFLEPALSIINTCLPVTQPVAGKALKFFGVKGSSSTNRSWNTSSAVKQPSAMHGNSDARNFTRLDDHAYPLTEGIGTYNHISGPGSKEIADSCDLEEPSLPTAGILLPQGSMSKKIGRSRQALAYRDHRCSAMFQRSGRTTRARAYRCHCLMVCRRISNIGKDVVPQERA